MGYDPVEDQPFAAKQKKTKKNFFFFENLKNGAKKIRSDQENNSEILMSISYIDNSAPKETKDGGSAISPKINA